MNSPLPRRMSAQVDAGVTAPARHHQPTLARFLDGATDLAVLGYAVWTLLYQAAKLLGWPTNPILIVSVVLCLTLVVPVLGQYRLPEPSTSSAASADDDVAPSWRSPWVLVSMALAFASVLVLRDAWLLSWVLATGSGLIAVAHLLRLRRSAPNRQSGVQVPEPTCSGGSTGGPVTAEPTRLWSHLLVLFIALVWSVFSLFTLRVDPDDAFYVNKAVFVGENGLIPTRDTIFGDQTAPALPGAGTAPLQSIEVLQGALAHLLGLETASVVYLLFPPLLTFLATWSIWRLIREWARVRPALAFAVSMVYLAMSAQTGAGMGVFFLARIWQGKVVFVAALIPLIYLFVTRWTRTGSRWYLLMMAAAGVSAVGLTSSATFVVPIIAVTCLVALFVTRRRWAGVLALSAYPVITGGIVALTGVPGDPGGRFYAGADAFHFVLGYGLLAAIGWAGIMLAGWLTVPGSTRVVVTAATLSLLVVLAPGVAALFSSATGAGAVAWRLMWLAPVTVMVGLLATVPLPSRKSTKHNTVVGHATAGAVAAALVVTLTLAGTPFWSPVRSVHISSQPTWKYPKVYINQALAIRRLGPGPGPVLAPLSTMRALSLVSSDVHAVAARPSYIAILSEEPQKHDARIVLTEVFGGGVAGRRPPPSQAAFTAALSTLEVSLTCVRPTQKKVARWLKAAGWTPQPLRELTCYSP